MSRLSILYSLIIALSVFVSGNAPASKSEGFIFGVGIHLGTGRDSLASVQKVYERDIFSGFRDDAIWSRVVYSGATIVPSKELLAIDRFIPQAGESAVPLIVIGYGNPSRGVSGFPVTESQIQEYLRYVKWVVARYRNTNAIFEIWNEWSAGLGSGVNPRKKGTAESYIRLLRRAYLAAKEVSPSSIVLGGGVAGTDSNWFFDFVDGGGLRYVDGVSLHPYVHFKKKKGLPSVSIDWLDRMYRYSQRSGETRPFYVTEIGWPGGDFDKSFPDELSRNYLLSFTMLARARTWIRGVWWYELVDGQPRQNSIESHFGIIARNGEKKPAYRSAAFFASLLRDFDIWKELPSVGSLYRIQLRATSRDRVCVAAWAEDGATASQHLIVSGSNITVRNIFDGDITNRPGKYEFDLRQSVLFACSESGDINVSIQ